ncbi:MAG: RND transporter, partial [Betaproteobacteria bacterium]|nr:RND transporter [Betaproteobacteria bacterium]
MKLPSMMRAVLALTGTCLLGACMVGPKYNKPPVVTPAAYKETGDWKIAQPRDAINRG